MLGIINHDAKREGKINWFRYYQSIQKFLPKEYYVKDDLAKYLEGQFPVVGNLPNIHRDMDRLALYRGKDVTVDTVDTKN